MWKIPHFFFFLNPPPKKKVITIFLATRPFFEHFWQKVYFSLWKSQNTQKNFKKIGVGHAKCQATMKKVGCNMEILPQPLKMSAAPGVMFAAIHLMFIKTKREAWSTPMAWKSEEINSMLIILSVKLFLCDYIFTI